MNLSVLVTFLSICGTWAHAKSVKTRLNANWRQTPLLAEIGEFIASENAEKYWKFVEAIHEENLDKSSDRVKYNFGISTAEKLVESSDLLRLTISTRTLSPRIEAHRQIGNAANVKNCSAFFVFKSQFGCHLSELNIENVEGIDAEVFEFDHIYPGGSTATKTLMIYGELGSSQFKQLYLGAKKLADTQNDVRFVFRHFHNSAIAKPLVSLSGYGVELAIKNTEYKAVDSDKKGEEPQNLHGFNFKTLREKHKNLEKELESLRDHLDTMGEIAPLKSWQLQDLGFQTCQKLTTYGIDLESAESLLQDFPLHARSISHVKVGEKFRKSIERQQKNMGNRGIEKGTNVLAINGRIVSKDGSNIDLFSLLPTVQQEKKAVDAMSEIGFRSDTDFSRVLTVADLSPIDSSSHAFDYRDARPRFLNDLESKYGPYKALQLLFQPYPPGQIRPISRNIFTLVLFSDPFELEDQFFDAFQDLLAEDVYIRFGVVPVFDETKHGVNLEKAVNSKSVAPAKRRLWPTKEKLLEALKNGNRFLKRTGLKSAPLLLLNGYPLEVATREGLDSALSSAVQKQTLHLQLHLYNGKLDDNAKIADWWLNKHNNKDITDRVNQRITSAFNKKTFVQIRRDSYKDLNYLSESQDVVNKNADVTTWILADFDVPEQRTFALEVLNSNLVKHNNKVAVISNRKDTNNFESCDNFLENSANLKEAIAILKSGNVCASRQSIPSEIGLKPGQIAIVSNGLIIGPLEEHDLLVKEDFEFLEKLWIGKRAQKTAQFLNEQFEIDVSVDFYSKISQFIREGETRIDFGQFRDQNEKNFVRVPAEKADSPALSVTWIANPASREAQQIISVVNLIRKSMNANVEIIFNPVDGISEMPIKRFYRFVGTEELGFTENGDIETHQATFSNLPLKQLLTMSVHTNDAWMIEVKQAEYDLDNIVLEKASGNVEGVFSLEHILVEGQATKAGGEPANGLEIELQSGRHVFDTIVMMNLGYFQLKAVPGVWNLQLREGTSDQRNSIDKVDSSKVDGDVRIVVDSLTGRWIKLSITEKGTADPESAPSSIENLINSAKSLFSTPEPSEVINVFSLASGHLYERFMRIMMVSVMKRTRTQRVKFWLLKNYLSPKFKESVPLLAEFYGFEYEFVEYKWPKWLHQQTEKQRVMWGYKILFLDVLFPLNVDKIIFVDADQVVRADLQELMDFNLKGAPYGYVPFCDSRKEMDGFRFWNSGYWKDHLMERRYHISALYVVDLKKFREFSAGDRLRGRYAGLSADPNSLSNLDQDLPNNMIHEVPITSLPQDWLWCETWCDDESKKTAKTIDLCNNPLTKEPKLNSAQRIIGEWKEIDEEIQNILNGKTSREVHTKMEL